MRAPLVQMTSAGTRLAPTHLLAAVRVSNYEVCTLLVPIALCYALYPLQPAPCETVRDINALPRIADCRPAPLALDPRQIERDTSSVSRSGAGPQFG